MFIGELYKNINVKITQFCCSRLWWGVLWYIFIKGILATLSSNEFQFKLCKATASWNVVHRHPYALKVKWIITTFNLIIFYCLTTFCNIKFFIYLPLGIFYLGLYSSFLLIQPSAVQHKLSISFGWGACTLSFLPVQGLWTCK